MARRKTKRSASSLKKRPAAHIPVAATHRLSRRTHGAFPHQDLSDRIQALLYSNDQPLKQQEIAASIDLTSMERKGLDAALSSLIEQGVVTEVKGRRYAPASDSGLVKATIDMHPRGFAFAKTAASRPGKKNDPYIHGSNLLGASHNDQVLVRIRKEKAGRRQEATVVAILKRASSQIAGIYHAAGSSGLVVPEDERIPFRVIVHRGMNCGATDGVAVIVALDDFPKDRSNPEGRIIEVLGDPASNRVQTRLVMARYSLPSHFAPDSLSQAETMKEPGPAEMDDPDRIDLREIPHVTIDGEDAKDFDDAVALSRLDGGGFRLLVSIADVSAYVEPGTPLDLEAFERGTSTYFPGFVVPMLPEKLSNGLCSLVPYQDRLAFTAVMDFDDNGERTQARFSKSVIKSHARLTYDTVARIVQDKDPASRADHKKLAPMLDDMARLAKILERKRVVRGSINLSIPEVKINLADDNSVKEIVRVERNLAHQLIEEFMLAANEAVAQALAATGKQAMYRIHEPPDPAKVDDFVHFSQEFGLTREKDPGSPPWFNAVLAAVKATDKELLVNTLLLRTMQQARYHADNLGHFGLAAEFYTHFTSPIRRYPDLIVHRLLSALLRDDNKTPGASPTPLAEAADLLSTRERNAAAAEWAMKDRLKARYMADHIDEEFDGIVAGITDRGFFVDLDQHLVSGMVSIEDLGRGGFVTDRYNTSLSNEKSGWKVRLGEPVRVRLQSVDLKRGHLNFTLVQD